MKKTIILSAVFLAAAAFTTIDAQVTPAGAGDKDLRDSNVRGRSNELERVKRDAQKPGKRDKDGKPEVVKAAETEDVLAAKYEAIKTDYELIQVSQDAVIKAYQSGDKVDYAQIGKSATEINQSATRLNSNLFTAPVVVNTDVQKLENTPAKKVEPTEKESKKPKSVRDIIVELDNAVGAFATSSMFQNLRVVDPTVSEKTKIDLDKIIELSGLLNAEAAKMTTGK